MRLSPAQILENASKLVPRVAARADEIARLRRLPADLVAQLKAAGVFRMPMPAAWGGPEMSPRAQNTVRTHIAVQERLMEPAAALAVGEDPPVPYL
jgi:alkylation response protein AidB-like acyl-CoA dehydrogenase